MDIRARNPGAEGLRINKKAMKSAAAVLINNIAAKTIHWIATQKHLPTKYENFPSIELYTLEGDYSTYFQHNFAKKIHPALILQIYIAR